MQRVTFEKSIVVFLAKFTTLLMSLTRDLNSEYQILDRNSLDLYLSKCTEHKLPLNVKKAAKLLKHKVV